MKTNKTLMAASAVAMMASVASAGVCFDYSAGTVPSGTMGADGSWYQDPNSAIVEAQHADGNWYPVSKGLDIATCPTHDGVQAGTSDCYYGWNDADMFNAQGVPEVRVTLSQYVSSSAATWGYTNAGLLYILNGTTLEDPAKYSTVDIGSSVTINAKIAAGKTAKIYLNDANYDNQNAMHGLFKANAVGTGSYQDYTLAQASFSNWNGAENTLNMAAVKSIAIEYEIAAATSGAPFPGMLQETLGWNSLSVANDAPGCGGTGAVSKVASAKQVGFAALRNGLQFSNLGSSTLNVQIFNTLGKVVASSKVTAKNSFVSTEALSNGVYVVRATDGAKLNMMRNVTVMR